MQAVEIGPDGALYAATVPSGKVYKLDAAATTKIDEQKATVVFDAGGAGREPAGASASQDRTMQSPTSQTRSRTTSGI